MALELYAKIEPYLGFKEERFFLYSIFLEKLTSLNVKRVLDVGCGSGDFLELARKEGFEIKGIDLSYEMVKQAKKKGLDAQVKDVCECKEKFEAVTAIFDVLNYIPPNQLERFLSCIYSLLEPEGLFLADINTLYGFEEVASGALVISKKESFIALDSEFDGKTLTTTIDFFKRTDNCYTRERDKIIQYYYEVERFKNLPIKLVEITPISLFGENADKALLMFKKEKDGNLWSGSRKEEKTV